MALKAAIDNFFGMSSRNTQRRDNNNGSGGNNNGSGSGSGSGSSSGGGSSGVDITKGGSDNRSLQKAAAIDAIAVAFDRLSPPPTTPPSPSPLVLLHLLLYLLLLLFSTGPPSSTHTSNLILANLTCLHHRLLYFHTVGKTKN